MSLKGEKLFAEAVIFDLDGTLIDSIGIYFAIIEKALERLDLPAVSRNQIIMAAENENFNWDLVLPQEVLNRKETMIDRAWAVINEIAPKMFADNLDLIRGADRMVAEMAFSGIKIGLVTATLRQHLEVKMQPLKNAGIDKLFAAIIASDDVEKRKPDPEPLIFCARQLDIKPGNCVYIGDTTTDIMAGRAARMQTVGVLTGFDDYESLKREGPDAVIDSIRDLGSVIALK